ncbi:MAG: S1C family serine protease [Thermoguttaceae bacterium]
MKKPLLYALLLVGLGLLCLSGLVLIAQEVVEVETVEEQVIPQIPEYYLGIQCEPVPEILAEHLELGDVGLLILAVVPDGPADQAGLLKGDIVLQLDGKSVKKITDIFATLERDKDKEQKLEIMRKGKKQEIQVKPGKRPEGMVQGTPPTGMFRQIQPGIIFQGPNGEETRGMISRFIEQMEKAGIDIQAIEGADRMFGNDPLENRNQFSVQIVPGSEPGTQRIQVRKDNEIWDVEKVEDLPEELQGPVQRMIGPSERRGMIMTPKKEKGNDSVNLEETLKKSWDDLRDKMKTELESFDSEVKKLQLPDFEAIYNKYRKSVEEDIDSLIKQPESK